MEDLDDVEDMDDVDMEKLRAYEVAKLRYYYAIVECDAIETANSIYKALDGTNCIPEGKQTG